MVLKGDADCGFFPVPVKEKLEVVKILDEPMLAIVSENHPLAERKCFPLEDIKEYHYIGMKNDADSEIADFLKKYGIAPNASIIVDSDYQAMAMVERNLGFGIFSRTALEDCPFSIRMMEFSEPLRRTVFAGVRSMETCSEATKQFIEFTHRWISEKYDK